MIKKIKFLDKIKKILLLFLFKIYINQIRKVRPYQLVD
jgi:hypothetical protein